MNDQAKLDEIKALFDNPTSFTMKKLEIALPIIETLEDRADRDSYLCISAEWLAQYGELQDLNRALELTRLTTISTAKCSAFIIIASRYMGEKRRDDAIAVLKELEQLAGEMLESAKYTELEKATTWDQIGDVFLNLGEKMPAKYSWDNAFKLANIGQENKRTQEAHDNTYLLHALAKKIAHNGFLDDAIKIANAIKMESWRESALDELKQYK